MALRKRDERRGRRAIWACRPESRGRMVRVSREVCCIRETMWAMPRVQGWRRIRFCDFVHSTEYQVRSREHSEKYLDIHQHWTFSNCISSIIHNLRLILHCLFEAIGQYASHLPYQCDPTSTPQRSQFRFSYLRPHMSPSPKNTPNTRNHHPQQALGFLSHSPACDTFLPPADYSLPHPASYHHEP